MAIDILTASLSEIAAEAAKVDPATKAKLDKQAARCESNKKRNRAKRAEQKALIETLAELPEGYKRALLCEGGNPDAHAPWGHISAPRHHGTERAEAVKAGRYVRDKKALQGTRRFRGDDLNLDEVASYRFLSCEGTFNTGGLDMSSSRHGTTYAPSYIKARRRFRSTEDIDPNNPGDQRDFVMLQPRSLDDREMNWGNARDEEDSEAIYRGPELPVTNPTEKAAFDEADLPRNAAGEIIAKVL